MQMSIHHSRLLDFGQLCVREESSTTPHNIPFLHLVCSGYFDGFQQGPDGSVVEYFEKILPHKALRVVINLQEVSVYTDLALVLVETLQKILRHHHGNALVVAPPHHHKMLTFLRKPFCQTLQEAVTQLDASGRDSPTA
jgi:hypothetical protein